MSITLYINIPHTCVLEFNTNIFKNWQHNPSNACVVWIRRGKYILLSIRLSYRGWEWNKTAKSLLTSRQCTRTWSDLSAQLEQWIQQGWISLETHLTALVTKPIAAPRSERINSKSDKGKKKKNQRSCKSTLYWTETWRWL